MKLLILILISSVSNAGEICYPCAMYAHSLNRRILELQNVALQISKEADTNILQRLATNRKEVELYSYLCKESFK